MKHIFIYLALSLQALTAEEAVGNIVAQLSKEGTYVIDAGARIGAYTVIMSCNVGPQGTVVAFEPNNELHSELLQTLESNHCKNVVTIPKGLSDGEEILAETITLDSLGLNNVSFIKIDVENYEYLVLKGAEGTILRNRPVIIFECEKANFDRVIDLLESYDYDVRVIFCNDFIAFPNEAKGALANYKKQFKKLD